MFPYQEKVKPPFSLMINGKSDPPPPTFIAIHTYTLVKYRILVENLRYNKAYRSGDDCH